ncbi:hypothetical protein KKB18_03460, partial [bacterium]|nr:hypothetical protein [bacterium]
LKSINYERTRLFTHSLSYSNPILWLNIMNDFIRAVGYPLAILFFCGLLYPFKKKIEWTVMVGVICGLIFYFGNSLVSRYLIFVMPMIAVISSHCAFSLIESKMKFVSIISSCVVIFISIYSISYSAAAVYSRFDDTRTRAARFVDEKIHPDSSIGIALTSFRFGGKLPHSWKYPKIDFNKFRFVNFLEKPEYLILSSFDYEKILRALKSNKISSYYVWKEEYNKEWYRSTPPTPEIFKFYDDLFFKNKGEYELIISFQKRQLKAIAVPAPEILIYKKR